MCDQTCLLSQKLNSAVSKNIAKHVLLFAKLFRGNFAMYGGKSRHLLIHVIQQNVIERVELVC